MYHRKKVKMWLWSGPKLTYIVLYRFSSVCFNWRDFGLLISTILVLIWINLLMCVCKSITNF